MKPFSHIDLPPAAREILATLAVAASGASLIFDPADSLSHLLGRGFPLSAPAKIRQYATLISGAAIVLSEGWSLLPPGVAFDSQETFPEPPSARDWVEAVGPIEATKWMTFAVWVGAEFTAQRALPVPSLPGRDSAAMATAVANWRTLGSTSLTPAVAAYPQQANALGVDEILKRAAYSLGLRASGSTGPGSPLWQFNQRNRHALAHTLARRGGAAQVADMFAFEDGYADTPGSSLLAPPPQLRKDSSLHSSALGVFDLTEWPLASDILAGSDLAATQQALRRNLLGLSGTQENLRPFLTSAALLVRAEWMKEPMNWELAAALLTAPTDMPSRPAYAMSASAQYLSERFLRNGRSPRDYLRFRELAAEFNSPTNSIAQLVLECDGQISAGWGIEIQGGQL